MAIVNAVRLPCLFRMKSTIKPVVINIIMKLTSRWVFEDRNNGNPI